MVIGMNAAKEIELLSVEEYLAGEERSEVRHEYLGGYVYAMAGARTQHNRIAGAFYALLFNQLRGKPCEPFHSDMKVRLRVSNHTRFYYPDGMVVCEPNSPSDAYQDRPVVLAEVISEATRRVDEGEKRDAYLTIPTLATYLLIESDRPRVVVHERTEQGFSAHAYEGLDAVIPLASIGVDLPLAELYERTPFTESGS